jgi:hypothetical protein
MPKYFRYFPEVTHSGFQVADVTKKVRFLDQLSGDPYLFLPYTVKEGDKPEDISYLYYGSVDYVWTIYLANNIIDPYQEWPMDQSRLDRYIEEKYTYACAECAINSTNIFNVTKTEFIILLDAYDKNISTAEIPFYTERYARAYDYIVAGINQTYLNTVLTNFRNLLFAESYSYDPRLVTSAQKTEIFNLTNDFVTDIYMTNAEGGEMDIPTDLREIIVRIPDKNILQEEFNVLNWTKLTTSSVRNILHYVNVDDPEYKISVETYNLSTGATPLVNGFVSSEWRAVRAYDYEFEENENRRQIFVVDRRYIDQVERELKSILA